MDISEKYFRPGDAVYFLDTKPSSIEEKGLTFVAGRIAVTSTHPLGANRRYVEVPRPDDGLSSAISVKIAMETKDLFDAPDMERAVADLGLDGEGQSFQEIIRDPRYHSDLAYALAMTKFITGQ